MITITHTLVRTVLTILLLAVMSPSAGAQRASDAGAPGGAQVPGPQASPQFERLVLTAGRSTVLMTDYDVIRIAVTDPDIANAVVVEPREILIDGRGPGTISLIVWGTSRRVQYDVVVQPPVSTLQQQFQALYPEEAIEVRVTDEATILSGAVSSPQMSLRAAEIAAAATPGRQIINLLEVPGGTETQQVMLQVRFGEVSRTALTELGASFFTTPLGIRDYIGRTTTQQFPAPDFEDLQITKENGEVASISGELTFSDFLNVFLLSARYDVGAVIRALRATGSFQSLAEPNLIAYNGQEASFLAGGEVPIPVVQGLTGAVSIEYKEFGIRLTFTPTLTGDLIRLKVRPEVSSLDFAAGISVGGFRVPALTTRYAETEVELRDGQSFAIAGLLDNISQEDRTRVPLLGSLPIIGPLFRARADRAARTELMVLITPRLVRPLDPDEVPPLPTLPRQFLPPEDIGAQLEGPAGPIDGPGPVSVAAAASGGGR